LVSIGVADPLRFRERLFSVAKSLEKNQGQRQTVKRICERRIRWTAASANR
jgi:hypothetical protein